MVADRLKSAEMGHWDAQLRQLCADLDDRERVAAERTALRPPADVQAQRHVDAVRRVLADDVPAAVGILMGDVHAPQTYETAAEVERLMCAPVHDDERQAVQDELRACRALPDSTSVAARHVKRRLRVVAAKRKAGPGPSGWRNSYIAGMGEARGGIAQLRLWTELWARGRIDATVVPLWNGPINSIHTVIDHDATLLNARQGLCTNCGNTKRRPLPSQRHLDTTKTRFYAQNALLDPKGAARKIWGEETPVPRKKKATPAPPKAGGAVRRPAGEIRSYGGVSKEVRKVKRRPPWRFTR
jgi:hypothetical protein